MNHFDRLPGDLMYLLLRTYIYPNVGARQMQLFRGFGRAWRYVYAECTHVDAGANHISRDQPSRGGLVPMSFLLNRDELQRRAGAGLGIHTYFPKFAASFGEDRTPRLVATSSGILCMLLSEPAQLVIWNPIVDDRIFVALPPEIIDISQIGLHVAVTDREAVSPRCTLFVPFHNSDIPMHYMQGGVLGSWSWNTIDRVWVRTAVVGIYQGTYKVGTAITLGDSLYQQISNRCVYRARIQGDGDAVQQTFILPYTVSKPLLSVYDGSLAIWSLNTNTCKVTILMKEHDEWVMRHEIDLTPVIESNRSEFRSSGHLLRSGGLPEPPAEALSGGIILAAHDNYIFVHQRAGTRNAVIRITTARKSAKRLAVDVAAIEEMSVLWCASSFLRLIAQPPAQENENGNGNGNGM